ncbi:hypothetical protein [Arenibaculum sp.]|uniref:hypothetical protein n=1 Tax=Arenibaculum sp. TaxID=2865862 RepID=UPI002E11D7B8|nr:hypothetical protein [Arenibaculum sp.]
MTEDPEPGANPGRDVPGGGTTRNTGGRRTGVRDAHGRNAGGSPRRWIIPLAFVLLLLVLLLLATVPE